MTIYGDDGADPGWLVGDGWGRFFVAGVVVVVGGDYLLLYVVVMGNGAHGSIMLGVVR